MWCSILMYCSPSYYYFEYFSSVKSFPRLVSLFLIFTFQRLDLHEVAQLHSGNRHASLLARMAKFHSEKCRARVHWTYQRGKVNILLNLNLFTLVSKNDSSLLQYFFSKIVFNLYFKLTVFISSIILESV